MNVIKIENFYLIKDDTRFLPGKYISEEVAQYAIDSIKQLDLDSVWNFVLSLNKTSGNIVEKEDIDHFIS